MRRLEAECIQATLAQELENTQIELENICKLKSMVSLADRWQIKGKI